MKMKEVEEILEFNKKFVAENGYKRFITDKFPAKKIAIVTCMDTRLVELLPAALGIRNGDVKMIKNAGGVITDPFDSTMRSLLVGIYELGVKHIMVIGHTNCGVQGMSGEHMLHLMKDRGVDLEKIKLLEYSGINLEKWLTGFEDTTEAVKSSLRLIEEHPLIPSDVTVSGHVIDTETGELYSV